MIRLSRKAWNNVLIFSVLIMILLFNSTNNILNRGDADDNAVRPLVPRDAIVMTLDYGPLKIERIGQGWRFNGALSEIDGLQSTPEKIVRTWQTSSMTPVNASVSEAPMVVVVWLAGEAEGRVYQLFDDDHGVLVVLAGRQYRIDNISLAALIPQGVL